MLKDIAVVIVNWNSNELVVEQVKNLSQFVEEIIVVDNNSDTPLSSVLKDNEHCVVIQNKYNRGFASACNQGLARVTKKWTLFLNPDVNLTQKNLEDFENFATKNRVEAVSVDTSNDNYSKPVPTVMSLLSEFTFLKSILPQETNTQKTLIGGILFINTNTLKKIGGWDERFFLWFEDSDLTKQLIDASIPFGFCDTKIEHVGGQSIKKLSTSLQKQLFFHAMNVYAKKHFSVFGQMFIKLLSIKYSRTQKLPIINSNITSLVIANSDEKKLDAFLQSNLEVINSEKFSSSYELILVTDSVISNAIFEYRKNYPNIRFITLPAKTSTEAQEQIGKDVATGKNVKIIQDTDRISEILEF